MVATYDYRDERGDLVFQVCRFEPKDFRQRKPDGKGGWAWSVKGLRRLPYRLPELLAAPTDRTVFIVEGEKDADRLAGLGLVATCNPGGAGKWRSDYNAFFVGRDAVILPDNDDAGRGHAQAVAANLAPIAARVWILERPGLPPKCDVSDWLAAGGTREELERLAAEARVLLAEVAKLQILVTPGQRHEAADAGLAALFSAGVEFYQRDRSLVRCCVLSAKASNGDLVRVPGIMPVTLPALG
jgi:putative DNA primase/helicase